SELPHPANSVRSGTHPCERREETKLPEKTLVITRGTHELRGSSPLHRKPCTSTKITHWSKKCRVISFNLKRRSSACPSSSFSVTLEQGSALCRSPRDSHWWPASRSQCCWSFRCSSWFMERCRSKRCSTGSTSTGGNS